MESRQATISQTRAVPARMRRVLACLYAERLRMHLQQHALFTEGPIEEVARLEAQLRELEGPQPNSGLAE